MIAKPVLKSAIQTAVMALEVHCGCSPREVFRTTAQISTHWRLLEVGLPFWRHLNESRQVGSRMLGFRGKWTVAFNHRGQVTIEFKLGKLEEALLKTHPGSIVAAY